MPKITALQVATALAKVNPNAGQSYSVTEPQSVKVRAANLLQDTKYGPYVAPGDPFGWSEGKPLATILMECKGHKGDCGVPLDYYAGGFQHAAEASDLLDGGHIEFVNAAVALVWAD